MDLVIRNVRLIDCTGAEPVSWVSAQVDRGVLSWIGEEAARPRARAHHDDIDASGLTLIPGMVDCHEHFTGNVGLDPMHRLLGDSPEVFTLKALDNCRRTLMSSVTSARDVGARYGINILVAQNAAAGSVLGPRIVAAGEWLQYPGCWPAGLTSLIESPEDLLLAIQEQIEMGTGLIKVGATGIGPNGEQFPILGPEALSVAVQAAHEAGLKIASHCHGYEGTRQSVEAGVDSIEYGTWVDDETVDLMAERGTYLVPTMSTWDTRERLGDTARHVPGADG